MTMRTLAIIILVVASIVSIFLTARKNKLRREEEARREEERKRAYYAKTTKPKARTLPVIDKAPNLDKANGNSAKKAAIDPFESIGAPFEGVAVPEEGSLSPAQYYEWLCDFRAAEKAGVRRPIKTGKPSPFAARIARTDEMSYLYKLSGFTPQNSLNRMPIEEKVKPQNPSSLLRNEKPVSFTLDPKFSLPPETIKHAAVSFDIYPKDPSSCDTFTSFYKDKN